MDGVSIEELEREIRYHEDMLRGLDESSASSAGGRETIIHVLNELRAKLESTQALPDWGNMEHIGGDDFLTSFGPQTPSFEEPFDEPFGNVHVKHPRISGSSRTPRANSSSGSQKSSRYSEYSNHESPFLNLPNRSGGKRPLDNEKEPYAMSGRENKSRRATPSPAVTAPTTPSSTTDSLDFELFDDPILQQLLGGNVKGQMRDSRKYEKELQLKREQEKADEDYARMLQEEFNLPQTSSSKPSNLYQSTFDPVSGAIHRSMPPPPPPRPMIKSEFVKSEKGQKGYLPFAGSSAAMPGAFSVTDFPSPISLSDTDSDIQEITEADFTPRRLLNGNAGHDFYGAWNPGYPAAPISGMAMPGAFPAPYASVGGSSVYNPTAFNRYTSASIGSNLDVLSAGQDSLAFPFDPTDRLSNFRDYRDSLYSDPSKTEEEIKELLSHIRPDEDIDANSREGTPPQMKLTLMEHQKLGLAWMKKMEEGTNKGGILADDMGLGKTIQALALIISRPSPDPARKTTLIVAPVALMQQWKREIERTLKPRFRLTVHILHGDARHLSWSSLRENDVVLTTYGIVASELKRKLKWDEKLKMHPNARPAGKEDYQPILGSTSKWYRVILDEAQAIKNKATKTAIGASFIQSEYRWCMSGTPMQNNVTELYSLIHFLRIKPYNEADKFSRDFTRPLKSTENRSKEKAMRQLQALLKAILLRRTKQSKIDGKPILQLPPKTTQELRAVFSEDERDFYKALETQTQLKFNKYLKAGTVGRNYSNILVLLLRLRQACCHPHLIKDFAINTGGASNVDMIANARELPVDVVERLKQLDAFECPICMDAVLNPVIFNPCGHSICEDCFARWTDQALNNGDEGVGNLACPHCRSKVDTLRLTDLASFKRVYCQGEEGVEPLDEDGADEESVSSSDSDDSEEEDDDDDDDDDGEDLKDFIVPDDLVEYDTGSEKETGYRPGKSPFEKSKKDTLEDGKDDERPNSEGHKSKSHGKGKRKSKNKGKAAKNNHKSLAQLRKEGLKNKAAKKKYLRRLAKDFQMSAKIERTMKLLEAIHARGEGEKTIIFSGFTSFLDLLEVPIARNQDYGSYTRYDGSMSATERNDAVFKFTDRPECTIMLVSLKAGNSGLNLTAASQVIILDPHWNGYVEAQAIDRAYRIGQQRPVEVHRVLVDHEGFTPDENGHTTVEDRILTLQEKKRELVETALDETAGRSLARLGVRELGFLFVSR